jgi:hypothetical protein
MPSSGHHDLCLYRSPFRFVLEPEDESGTHSNGQENGQVRFPYGECPSRVGNLYPPLSRPHSIGGFAPSWERCPPYHHDPPVDQSAPTSSCCKTLASSQPCKNGWEYSCLTIYPIPSIYMNRFTVIEGLVSCCTRVLVFPNPSRERGLIKHASQSRLVNCQSFGYQRLPQWVGEP